MNKTDQLSALRHGALERLRFIDARLFWEARINRADLISAFAVSPAQAALDFREYLKLSLGGVSYDTRAKAYVAGHDFVPLFGVPDAATTFKSLGEGNDPWTFRLPELDRPLDAATAARVRRAARDRQRILVEYQSFTKPDAAQRWIAPARLINDGQRWHMRGWCFQRHEWRDFVLARIAVILAAEPAGELPVDREWDETIELNIRPAARLSKGQQESVKREFAMVGGTLSITLPRAMRIYAVRRWGLDRADSRLELVIEARDEDEKAGRSRRA